MKIAVFGGTGTIGSEVVDQLLKKGHEVIRIGSRTGEIMADYTDPKAVEAAFQQMIPLDGIVVTVGGDSVFKPYQNLSDDDYRHGAERKLVAQFRLVRLAEKYLEDNGSITLTSGFLSHYPNAYSIATGPFNAAIDAFTQHTAPLLARGLRLNVVSPAAVVEPNRTGPGRVSAAEVSSYYLESIEGKATGQIYRVWGGLPLPATP